MLIHHYQEFLLQAAYLEWLKNRFKVDKFFDEKTLFHYQVLERFVFNCYDIKYKTNMLAQPFYQVYLGPSLLDNMQKSF